MHLCIRPICSCSCSRSGVLYQYPNMPIVKNKYVKEQVLIIYLGLGLEEAHHPWSKDGHEYTGVELLKHFVKVYLPLTKTKKLPKEAPVEHPRLPEFATLGMLTSDVANYYSTQTKNNNKLRLKVLRE